MAASKRTVERGLWELWPVQSRRNVLRPIYGLSSTLGMLSEDTGEAEHYPDHCNHGFGAGLIKTGDGICCLFCDSFPAHFNPQFFEKDKEE